MDSTEFLPHLVIVAAVIWLARPGTRVHRAIVSTTTALAGALTGTLALPATLAAL
jgi:hypothetical protein